MPFVYHLTVVLFTDLQNETCTREIETKLKIERGKLLIISQMSRAFCKKCIKLDKMKNPEKIANNLNRIHRH